MRVKSRSPLSYEYLSCIMRLISVWHKLMLLYWLITWTKLRKTLHRHLVTWQNYDEALHQTSTSYD